MLIFVRNFTTRNSLEFTWLEICRDSRVSYIEKIFRSWLFVKSCNKFRNFFNHSLKLSLYNNLIAVSYEIIAKGFNWEIDKEDLYCLIWKSDCVQDVPKLPTFLLISFLNNQFRVNLFSSKYDWNWNIIFFHSIHDCWWWFRNCQTFAYFRWRLRRCVRDCPVYQPSFIAIEQRLFLIIWISWLFLINKAKLRISKETTEYWQILFQASSEN